MTGRAGDLRRWAVLARVRRLRVRRGEATLAQARQAAREARDEVARRTELLRNHAAQLPRLLAFCSHEHGGAATWRGALHTHRLQAAALNASVLQAQALLLRAEANVRSAMSALQRDIKRHDDARARERAALASFKDDDDDP
ncbi:hypothetical protein [Caballeronia sp. LZ001]|uniref:hypothetical protein n=1 Tax=Caballeronia sp. LZ001 TaxID=3038553 RepID=UPI00285F33B2|nr:hypothetical protein [Caballeronia sp. LZ001]MDR5801985.1 hypothetical protein [Caballeronia sp. LZ001]